MQPHHWPHLEVDHQRAEGRFQATLPTVVSNNSSVTSSSRGVARESGELRGGAKQESIDSDLTSGLRRLEAKQGYSNVLVSSVRDSGEGFDASLGNRASSRVGAEDQNGEGAETVYSK